MESIRERGSLEQQVFQGRTLTVYTPPSYGLADKRYPVVYVNDPSDYMDSVTNQAVTRMEELFREKKLPELILVGLEPDERLDEYTPWPAKALVESVQDFGGSGKKYLDLVVHELKPYIDGRYETLAGPAGTGMIGASLGGLISMFAAFEHPSVFGRIGSISGSFWYEGITEYMRGHKLADEGQRFYMYVGDQEGVGKKTIQSAMMARTRQAYTLLADSGFNGAKLRLVIGEGGQHQVPVFVEQFPEALKWIFGMDTNIFFPDTERG
ncbi:alpha/beta hydrolase [Paenibacillus chitinolyticus]|uniref:alpha/beta hydrolase n=1 Tax=Paenibacillus chitinolyticus TaxID=79263 RepID=UPI001C47C296|nr:alpha/beta hydrolase-fold protein [Paenibacillus chitinolyticus]MBV6715265.1 alpha/beta hydrolase [Paenibacillus chitinolyticus]